MTLNPKSIVAAALACLAVSFTAPAQTPAAIQPIVLTGEGDPFVKGQAYTTLDTPVLNSGGLITFGATSNYQGEIVAATIKGPKGAVFLSPDSRTLDVTPSGQMAFSFSGNSQFPGPGGLYFVSHKSNFQVVKINDAPAGGGTFVAFDAPSANEAGLVAFHGTSTGGPNDGVYLGRPAANGAAVYPAPAALALHGQDSLDGGTFTRFGSEVSINEFGQVAFFSETTGALGGGIYIQSPTSLNRLPTADGASALFTFNDAGQIVYFGNHNIWLGTKDGGATIVANGDAAPGGGTFAYFNDSFFGPVHAPGFTNSGVVAFRASTDNGPGNGIYLWTSAGTKKIAVLGPTPDGSDFYDFDDPFVDESGEVAFRGYIVTPSNDHSDYRLYWGNGDKLIKIAGIGDQIIGSDGVTRFTITDVQLLNDYNQHRFSQKGPMNDLGQVAYKATYANASDSNQQFTGIYLFTPPPQPPVFTGPSAASGVLGQPLSVAIAASHFPTAFTAAIAGQGGLPAGLTLNTTTGVISGTPQAAGTFTLNVTATNRGGSGAGVINLSIADLSASQGLYTGLIAAAPPTPATSGVVTVTVAANGGFSVSGVYDGKSFALKKLFFDAAGTATIPLAKGGPSLTLTLDLAHPGGAITGSLNDPKQPGTISVTAGLSLVYDGKTTISPFAGTYTVALPAHTEATYPQGTGYATFTVSPKGLVKLVGVLGDTTPFSAGGVVTKAGQFPIYAALYSKAGVLSGQLTLAGPKSTDVVGGALTWSKPVTKTPAWFPNAFTGQIAPVGSGFQAPPVVADILQFPNGAAFTIVGGGLAPLPAEHATLDSQNKDAVTFTPAGPKLAFKKTPAGSVAGTFTDTVGGKAKSFAFKGVVLQAQNRVEALFKGLSLTGTVELK